LEKLVRKAIRFLGKIFIFLLLFIAVVTAPIDRSLWKENPDYWQTFQYIDSVDLKPKLPPQELKAGWAKVNITPSEPKKLVGFKPSGPYEAIRDSLFVKAIALQVENQTVYIISYDLLLAPPEIVEAVHSKLGSATQLYFSATHTHTGFGGWDSSLASRFITGKFDENSFNKLVEKTILAIKTAGQNLERASIGFGEADGSNWVKNRLDQEGKVDGLLRFLKIETQSGKSAALVSFSAHSTNIPSHILALSRDYPGVLTDKLEEKTVDFALFCGGMMGSHKPKNPGLSDFALAQKMGEELSLKIENNFHEIQLKDAIAVSYHHIPVKLPQAQLRLTQGLAVRSFVFNLLLGKLEASITYLQLGDIVLLGMPCDFSGELLIDGNLATIAKANNLNLIITSFNGDYVGYITPDRYYDTKAKEEVRTLNWVGPNKGNYFIELAKRVLEK